MILIVSIRQLVTIFCEVKAIYSTPCGVVIFISKAATETRQCIINCYTTHFNQGYWRVTFTSNGLSKLIVQLGSNFSVKYLCRLQWFACASAEKYKASLGDVCNSDNYRGIALTSCINKVLDWVILLKYANYLKTSNLQFAYKERHSTAMCTLALKEVAKYYTSRRGRVYCCLLDATKAFDRVRFDKLFEILIERNVPACIIRILIDMYTRQTVRTVWEGCVSDEFSANNGVRQGGVLSPVLFTLYIDVLLNRLEQSGLGCYVAHEYFGALCSADDLALLAPNFACLKSMIQICESFAQEFDLLFNAKKTVCILFSGRTRHSGDPPPLYMNNVVLKWTKSAKHLGSIVTYDLKENEEINHKRNDFIGRANSVISNFKHVDKNVSSRVFMSQCCHLFGSQAWLLLFQDGDYGCEYEAHKF